jgi:putative Mg2+ transporter-C (MgtC) family protein
MWQLFATRLVLALLLGAFIGAERQWRQRMAGLRTNTLVAAGAAMFVMLSAVAVQPDDSYRIAGQVVSGIGFLGAGVILRNGLNVMGLNTAATLWCSGAIGTLCGYGRYGSAAVGALAVVVTNLSLRPVGKAINRRAGNDDADIIYRFRVIAHTGEEAHLRSRIIEALNGLPLYLKSLKSEDLQHTDKVEIQAILMSSGHQNALLENGVSRFSMEPGVSGVSWEIVTESE